MCGTSIAYITASRNDLVTSLGSYRTLAFASATTMPKKLSLVKDETATADDKEVMTLVTFYADASLLAKIDDYRWANRIEGRAKTVRELIIKATS
jgi:hypothetical protein